MVLSKNKQKILLLLAIIGMIVDALLRQSYEQALLINSLQNCSSGCDAKGVVLLPEFLGVSFAHLQWSLFAIQFVAALGLLRMHTRLLEKTEEYVIILHALALVVLFVLFRQQFTGSWTFVIITSVIVLLSLLVLKSKSLYNLKMRNKV